MNPQTYRAALPADLRDLVTMPGDPAYTKATTPRNATARQTPGCVIRATRPEHVAAAVRAAAETGVRIVPQATGHGAAGPLGEDVVLLDTSGLNAIEIDPERRVVRAQAGATFGQINAAAFRHGLLAPAGTSPDVAVFGYVVLGGVGWLTRPYGLASAALAAVDVVDGAGRPVGRDDERYDDVLWAGRGGGGAGIAISVELGLFPVEDLRAGYALWPVAAAEQVLPAWGAALGDLDPALTTAIGVLHAPDAPTVPESLRGQPVVHLAAATVAGADGEASLRRLLADLPAPAIETFGPCTAERLATIHLDPPVPVPARGYGRWLTAGAADRVHEILTAAGTEADSPLAEVELRHVASPGSDVPGALTSVPGPLVLHATGPAPDPETQQAVFAAHDALRDRIGPVDTGVSAPAFGDGEPSHDDAHPADVRRRLVEVRRRLDPDGVIGQGRATAS